MAGLFSTATLEKIRAASDIVEVIGSYLPLKKAGANFVALCPFHREKTPSFSVNPHLQIFHCFGCHKGGDVFRFLREFENIDFPEAVRRLAERAKIPLETESPGESHGRHVKETLLRIHDQLATRWQTALNNEASGQLGREYLARRGVTQEAIALFRIGCAPEAWDDTVNWAKARNFDLADVEAAGLIIRKEGTDRYYDRFRGRLMFPICDEQGRVIAFSGRVLKGDEKTAKYVNSPETLIFTKSKVFFGLDKSKRALLDSGFAIICEGQLDLIACYMAGIQNVVAPQGTAFTSDHARILKRYVDEVVLCFDSDEAGQNATVRALDQLLGAGLAIRVALVPSPHDPDSFIKEHGPEAFKELIQEAPGFFDYYLDRLSAGNDTSTDKGRLAVLNGMAEAVNKTANGVLIDKYAQKTALRLGVSADAVRAEFRKASRLKPRPGAEPQEETPSSAAAEEMPAPAPLEYWLLKIILLHDDLVGWTVEHIDPGWIQHAGVKRVVEERLTLHRGGTWTTVPALLEQIGEVSLQNLVTQAIAEDRPLPNPPQQIADIALRLRNASIDRERARLSQLVSRPEISEEQRLQLAKQMIDLQAAKREPLQPLAPSQTAR